MRFGQYYYTPNLTVWALIMTLKQKALAGELLRQTYEKDQEPGVIILGMWVRLIPFPSRDDKANMQKVGEAIHDSQSHLQGLQAIEVPKVKYPLSSSDQLDLVSNLLHCRCLSTFTIGKQLRYNVMVAQNPENAK